MKFRSITALGFMYLFVCLAQTARAISVNTLISTNGSISEGDTVFSHFELANDTVANFSPATGGSIDVQGITLGQDHGLRFSGPFVGPGPQGSGSAGFYEIRYDVAVTDSHFLLHDVREAFNATLGIVSEAFVRTGVADPNILIFQPALELTNVDGGSNKAGTFNTNTAGTFTRDVSSTRVLEGFNFDTVGVAGASVTVPMIDVTFSQTAVPEPSSWLLLGSGVAGMMLFRTRWGLEWKKKMVSKE